MKKFITAIILALVASLMFTANAQVEYQKPTAKKFEMVVSLSAPKLAMIHYFANDSYEIGVAAEKTSIDSIIKIKLGEGKATAIASLEAIRQMLLDAEHGGFVMISGKAWSAVKRDGITLLRIKQSGNISYNQIDLSSLNTLIKDFSADKLETIY